MMKLMKKTAIAGALALAALGARADVVCNSCDFVSTLGTVATYLGEHITTTFDNSTFSNATTGQNGDFTNWWIFRIDPAGLASINAIFLPINNIDNFDVDLFGINAQVCAQNTGTEGGACSAFGVGGLLASGLTDPVYATVIDFQFLDAGFYAFRVTGTISDLGPLQPASYTGNLQVNPLAVPEPGSLALAGLGLMGLGFLRRKA